MKHRQSRLLQILLIFTVLTLLGLILGGCASAAPPAPTEAPAAAPTEAAAAPTEAAAAPTEAAAAPTEAAVAEATEAAAVDAPEEAISVSGAFALFPIVTVWAEEYQKLHPNVTFDVQGGGAGKGMTDLLSGAADIAMLSREPKQEELDQGSFLVPVTIDAVLGTFNANNPYLEEIQAQGITAEEAGKIWITKEITTWGQLLGTDATDPINVYTRSDAAGAAEQWALFAGGKVQEDLQGTAVNADPGVAEAVRQDPLGVGYNNVSFTYDPATGNPNEGLRAIPLDLNGDGTISEDEDFYDVRQGVTAAIAARTFPFPPARVLYLVTKGEPSPTINDFYLWVLTDGQSYLDDAGFVHLSDERIQEALTSIGHPGEASAAPTEATAEATEAAAAPTEAAAAEATEAAAAADAPEEAISVSGAFALFPIVTVWAEEYQKLHPNVTFDVQGGGAGKGMTDMLSGAADIAMLSREPKQEELDQGSFLVPVTIDAVLGTFNANNPYLEEIQAQGITAEEAGKIWITKEITTWGQLLGTDATDPINVYTRSDAAGAAEQWALFAGGKVQEDLQGTAVNADPGVAEAVRQDPLGVGYNNVSFTYDPTTSQPNEGLRAIPLDLNGDGTISEDEDFYDVREGVTAAIAARTFPFPPARVLYLVTKGEPSPTINDFYHWVLTDGQSYLDDAGFVHLSDERIQEAITSLPK